MSLEERNQAAEHLRLARNSSGHEAAEAAAWARCIVPNSLPALKIEIRRCLELGDGDHADALIAKGLYDWPDHPHLLEFQAKRLAKAHDLETAITTIERVICLCPERYGSRILAGRILLRNDEPRRAIHHLETAVELRQHDADEAKRLLVDGFLAEDDIERAAWYLQELVPQPPLLISKVFRAEGRLLDAASELEESLKRIDQTNDADEYDETFAELIDVVDQIGDHPRLIPLLEEVTSDQPRSCIRAGEAWLAMGEFELAHTIAQSLLGEARWRRSALTIMTVASSCMDQHTQADEALITLGETSPTLDAQSVARSWRKATFGKAMNEQRHAPTPTDTQVSPLLRLIKSASDVFIDEAPNDAEAAAHLTLCRYALDGTA